MEHTIAQNKAPCFGGRTPLFSQRDLLRLVGPLLVEQLLEVTVGMADTMMVSRCGEAAISGVSLVDMINNLIIVLFSALATGGAVAVMLIRAGLNAWAALLCAFLAGMLAGFVTGLFHTKCGIPAILAGILTQLSLYSINLRIMGSKANQAVGVDKYDLLVSQRYVRSVSLDNPLPCCWYSRWCSLPFCTGFSARKRAAPSVPPAQIPTWPGLRASIPTPTWCWDSWCPTVW